MEVAVKGEEDDTGGGFQWFWQAGLIRYACYSQYCSYSLLLPTTTPFLEFSFSGNGTVSSSGPTPKTTPNLSVTLLRTANCLQNIPPASHSLPSCMDCYGRNRRLSFSIQFPVIDVEWVLQKHTEVKIENFCHRVDSDHQFSVEITSQSRWI